jgi:drug/metabolite transporter (DMT)-like permease
MAIETRTTSRQAMLAVLGLLAVAVVWGLSFPLTKQLLARTSPIDFLAHRYAVAAAVMLVLFFRPVRRLRRKTLLQGLFLGALYGVAQILQTVGLAHTSASVSGFITGMYVVLTPICAVLLLKTSIAPAWWLGAGLATVGLAVMSLNGLSVGFGELITLLSALLYALHIVGLGYWSSGRDAVGLAVVQVSSCAVICVLGAAPGGITIISEPGDWLAVLFMALISGAAAMIVQTWAQAHLAASRAAIIMCSEPVWAAGLAITFYGEPLTLRIGIGGLLMLVAMLVVEVTPRRIGTPPHPEGLPRLAT